VGRTRGAGGPPPSAALRHERALFHAIVGSLATVAYGQELTVAAKIRIDTQHPRLTPLKATDTMDDGMAHGTP
jgi:hypothetical protein